MWELDLKVRQNIRVGALKQYLLIGMRRQFGSTYDQAISLIKQLKNSNDHLNRAVGVDSQTVIAARLMREQPLIEATTNNIQDLIMRLEQTYLDPDTARKIGTAKQQFRIQRDRRQQLLDSANFSDASTPTSKENFDRQLDGQISQSTLADNSRKEKERSTWSRFTHKESEATSVGSEKREEEGEQVEMQMQMERKLMQERNLQINVVAKSIMNVHNIMQETGVMVHEQGEQLDIIGEELFTTYRNVNLARQNITEANQIQRSARRKYVYLSLLILVLISVAAILVFV